jgi:hypothetical protein
MLPAVQKLGFNFANLSSTVVSVVAILGGFWAIDSHYASAADVQVMQRSMETQIRSLKIERTEDEVFKLDMKKQAQKGKLSPEDEALYQRYLRKLNETNKEQRAADNAPLKK